MARACALAPLRGRKPSPSCEIPGMCIDIQIVFGLSVIEKKIIVIETKNWQRKRLRCGAMQWGQPIYVVICRKTTD